MNQVSMKIDAADFHEGRGADTREDAAWHIAAFLWWCAERGLASKSHAVESLREDATRHFFRRCDGKLIDDDLTKDGAAVAKRIYKPYLRKVAARAKALGVSAYALGRQPDAAAIREALFADLDALREG